MKPESRVEAAKRGGLDATGQHPQEQPTWQMGGRGPAQVVAPLQAKPAHVEIDEACAKSSTDPRSADRGADGSRASTPPLDCRSFAITPLDAHWTSLGAEPVARA